MEPDASAIEEDVRAFIRTPGDDASFERLTARVFAFQYQRVPAYRAFCRRRAMDPGSIRSWRDIPAIPSDAFKHDLLPEPPGGAHVFLSSGTSAGAASRSRHAVASLDTYREAATSHFERMVLPDHPGPCAVLVLGPTAATHPRSSLGRLFDWCLQRYASGTTLVAFDAEGSADIPGAIRWLAERAEGVEPVMVLGVSAAVTALFDRMRSEGRTLRLPAGSRLVDTGGAKGGARVLSAKGLIKAAWRMLHIPGYCCVNEYGMTEMLSQFYDDALRSRVAGTLAPRSKVGPPWVRTAIVDPATLEPVEAGATGILRHFDLANWESVSALQTLDLGRAEGAGFALLGRARGAERRGCSSLLREVRARAAERR